MGHYTHAMTHLPPLLSAQLVHDRRHLAVWLALTFAAGSTNAAALAACSRFVTHVTGTLTRVGVDVGVPILLLDYACVVLCFVLGAMTSVVLLDGRRMRGLDPWPVLPVALVATVTALTGTAGMMGYFGPFGQTVETTGDFVLLSMLGFAMGLQNAAVATTTGMVVRTTHMTGPVTDFSIALATFLSSKTEAVRSAAGRSVWLRGSKILMFVLGAMVTSLIATHLEYATFYFPAGITLGAAVGLHFLLRRSSEVDPAPVPS